MEPFFDLGDVTTVTNTTHPSTPTYKVTAPDDNFLVLGQISIGIDTDFISNGKVMMTLNGKVITSQGSSSEISLVNNYTFDTKSQDFIFLEPHQTFELFARVASGSGKIQTGITGTLLTREEFRKLQKKYLGDN